MRDFAGKVAVVTGAASGIGEALARALAGRGMRLVLGDIEEAPLEAVAADLTAGGAEVVAVPGDVTDRAAVEALGDAATGHFGGLHLACNNAGVSTGGLSWEIDDAAWDWVLGVNLRGVIHGVGAFVPRIIASGGGHVVNTASMAGIASPPFMAPYNVAKHGVVTLSETLYQELRLLHPEVGVSVLCPGWVNTRIHEADRNKPAGMAEPPPSTDALGSGLRETVASLIASGMDPAAVADLVVAAVEAEQFYVLTHDGWEEMARVRMQHILDGTNPEVRLPAGTEGL